MCCMERSKIKNERMWVTWGWAVKVFHFATSFCGVVSKKCVEYDDPGIDHATDRDAHLCLIAQLLCDEEKEKGH
jgi:hypothetical protein